MKELLAIAWEMPPLSGPRAVQVTRTLLALVAHDWRSRVVCFGPRSTRYNQDHHVAIETISGGSVQRVPVASPEETFAIRALWRIAPMLKHLPDEKRVWVPAALAAARRAVAERRPDVIVSFAQPWSNHLVALALHRETGVPWVAHFSDPWVDSPYASRSAWHRRVAARMEREVIGEATRVVFVNAYTADAVLKKYPGEWRARAAVVPQGFDRSAIETHPITPTGPLRLIYTGRFYDGRRTPQVLFAALAGLTRRPGLADRVVLDIVGGAMEPYQQSARTLGLDRLITFHGRKSPAESLAMAATADVLLVVDAASDGPNLFLPSKLIDYLPLGKPILGLTPRRGATADLLSQLGYATVEPDDRQGIECTIEALIVAKESGALGPSPHHDAVAAAYDIRETTKTMDRVLDEARAAA